MVDATGVVFTFSPNIDDDDLLDETLGLWVTTGVVTPVVVGNFRRFGLLIIRALSLFVGTVLHQNKKISVVMK